MKEFYIILNPDGGIALDMCTGKGKVYANLKKAETALEGINNWSKTKGYGKYELVILEVEK